MEVNFNNESLEIKSKDKITITKQQRNGRKSWTIIEDFAQTLEADQIKNFIKQVKKKKCCNGSLKDGTIIQFQGDCVMVK